MPSQNTPNHDNHDRMPENSQAPKGIPDLPPQIFTEDAIKIFQQIYAKLEEKPADIPEEQEKREPERPVETNEPHPWPPPHKLDPTRFRREEASPTVLELLDRSRDIEAWIEKVIAEERAKGLHPGRFSGVLRVVATNLFPRKAGPGSMTVRGKVCHRDYDDDKLLELSAREIKENYPKYEGGLEDLFTIREFPLGGGRVAVKWFEK